MKKYQYQILRYIHDRVTGEFVNVGLVLYMPEASFLDTIVINKYSRISHFFGGEVNGVVVLAALKQFDKELKKTAQRLTEIFGLPANLEELTNQILLKDDSALICTPTLRGIDIDGKVALQDLYKRLIEKYQEAPYEQQTDEDVWRKIYKNHFESYDLTNKLNPHIVKTRNDDFVFDRAYKNGVWNCYQPLNFDLKQTDTIKNKVYKWSGILKELESSQEEIHINLLTSVSSKYKEVNNFIFDTLQRSTDILTVSIVTEEKADELARQLKYYIEEHHNRFD